MAKIYEGSNPSEVRKRVSRFRPKIANSKRPVASISKKLKPKGVDSSAPISFLEEKKLVSQYDKKIKLDWSRALKQNQFSKFSPNYSFSFFKKSEDRAGYRPETDQIILHYDNYMAGMRPPFDRFLVECMLTLGALPCDFTPGAVRMMCAFAILCRCRLHEPTFSAFTFFFYFFKLPGGLVGIRSRKGCRLFHFNSNKVNGWESRNFLVSSKVGWPFGKFSSSEKDEGGWKMGKNDPEVDGEIIDELHSLMGWDNRTERQLCTYNWRILIDVSFHYSAIAGFPGPVPSGHPSLGIPHSLFCDPEWYASCHHQQVFPLECNICKGVASSRPDCNMSYLQIRKKNILALQAEQEKSRSSLRESEVVSPNAIVEVPTGRARAASRPDSGPSVQRNGKRKASEVENEEIEVEKESGDSEGACKILERDGSLPRLPQRFCQSGEVPMWERPGFPKTLDSTNMEQLRELEESIADVPVLMHLGWRPLTMLENSIGMGISERVIIRDVVDAPISPTESSSEFTQDAMTALGHGVSQVATLLARAQRLQELEKRNYDAAVLQGDEIRNKTLQEADNLRNSVSVLKDDWYVFIMDFIFILGLF